MLVMLTTGLSASGRGMIARWLQEFAPGVFVGSASALVREELWQLLTSKFPDSGFMQVWPTNNEQGYSVRVYGDSLRERVDFDGLSLLAVRDAAWADAARRFRFLGTNVETSPLLSDGNAF